jgi:hypothetical protein
MYLLYLVYILNQQIIYLNINLMQNKQHMHNRVDRPASNH